MGDSEPVRIDGQGGSERDEEVRDPVGEQPEEREGAANRETEGGADGHSMGLLTDAESQDIFGSDDCSILCGGLCVPPCLTDHHTGWEIFHSNVHFTVCGNALAAFEVMMHREDRYLHCVFCRKEKALCFCGISKARFKVKEGHESQKARGRIQLESGDVSSVFGTAGPSVSGQEGSANGQQLPSQEGAPLGEDPEGTMEEIRRIFGVDSE
jgi:hypothetical protein